MTNLVGKINRTRMVGSRNKLHKEEDIEHIIIVPFRTQAYKTHGNRKKFHLRF